MSKPLVCEWCGRKGTPESPVESEMRLDLITDRQVRVALCRHPVDCNDYIGEHGNDKQLAKWHYD